MSENLWVDIVEVDDLYAADPKLNTGVVVLDRTVAELHLKKMGNLRDVRQIEKVETIQVIDSDSDDEPCLIIDEESDSQPPIVKSMPNLDEMPSTSSASMEETKKGYSLNWAPINDPQYGFSETTKIKATRRKNIKPVYVDSGTQYQKKDVRRFCEDCILGKNIDNEHESTSDITKLMNYPIITNSQSVRNGLSLGAGPSVQISSVKVTRRTKRPPPNLVRIKNTDSLDHTMPLESNASEPEMVEGTDECYSGMKYDQQCIRMTSYQFGGTLPLPDFNFGSTNNQYVKDDETAYPGTTDQKKDTVIGISKDATQNYYHDTLSSTDGTIEKENTGKDEIQNGQPSLLADAFEIDELDKLLLESTTENLERKIEVFPDTSPKRQCTPTGQDQDDDILQLAVDDDFGEDAVEKPLTVGANPSKESVPQGYSSVLGNLYANTSSSNPNRFSKKHQNPSVLEWDTQKSNTEPSTSGISSSSAMNKKRHFPPQRKLDGGNNKRRQWNTHGQSQNIRPLMETQSPWNHQSAPSSSNISPEFQNILSIFVSLCRQQMHSVCPNPHLCHSNHNFPPHSWIDQKISYILDHELIRFMEICFENATCFNMYFPALSIQLSRRNMKQNLIEAIEICERPGYYVTHYKWIVSGLIHAQETPVKAIQILLSHCNRNDTRALGVIVDIIIKNHRDYNFLDVLIQISANPNFECTSQIFDTLVLNAIQHPDQRWETLIETLANNMREDVQDEIDTELLLHFLNSVQSH